MSRPEYLRASSTNIARSSTVRSLEGKLAIITGGSRGLYSLLSQLVLIDLCLGIGAAIATNLASKGASLVINYTSASSTEKASTLASTLSSTHGIRAITVQADIGEPTGPEHIISTAKNNFSHPKTGKFQIDIIINNAGVSNNRPLGEINPGDFHECYAINVLGPALLVQAALPYLPYDRSGRIVNTSSVSSSLGFIEQTVYGGTKAALESMTRTWARELAERCTVNAINPGPVDTEMWGSNAGSKFEEEMKAFIRTTPLSAAREGLDREDLVKDAQRVGGRPAYDHEIAGVVAMLCSSDAAWCTGSVVNANGGLKFTT